MAPPVPLRIDFDLHGAGWGTLTFDGETRYVVEHVSYLTDPLCDLLLAALACAIGAQPRPVHFLHEPGSHRLAFDTTSHDLPPEEWTDDGIVAGVRRRISLFRDDRTDFDSETGGDLVWTMEHDDPDFFSKAVKELAETVLATHGADGFRMKWDPKSVVFPTRGLAALAAALATGEAPVLN